MELYGYEIHREKDLSHHGILGMKWGKQNGPPYPLDAKDHSASEKKAGWRQSLKDKEDSMYKPVGKTLNKTYHEKQVLTAIGRDGKEITIEQIDKGGFARLLARGSKKVQQMQLNDKDFNIKVDGKTIGNMEIAQVNPDTVNGVWLGINEKNRGNGYATAVLMTALHECKNRGYKTFTLEVPGHSPDARHIYEKLGFVAKEQLTTAEEDPYWEGLTAMELDLTKYSW